MTLKQALFIQMSTLLLNMIEDDDDFGCNTTFDGDHSDLTSSTVTWSNERKLIENMNNYVAAKSKIYLSSCNAMAKEWGLDLDEDLDAGNAAAATQMFNYIMQGGKIEN